MFCPNCGSEIKETDKFCAKCGSKKEVATDTVLEMQTEAVLAVHKTYSFARSKYLLGYTAVRYCTVYTDISIENKEVAVKQWKSTFFKKYGRQNQIIPAEDLEAVTIEKVYSWGWIVYMLICVGVGFVNPLAWIFALVAVFFLKRKKIYIFHKNGRIHIPDEGNSGMEKVKDMVGQFKKIKPSIQILNMDNQV